jgi:serine/threonine-protein kinase
MASHGRYTIKAKLADGGMAEIFLAVQHGAEGFEKPVVLKRILTQWSADQQFRNMMLDEAHISMSLSHSNIAQVLDLGVAGGRYFLALELVDGWDLEKILRRAHDAGMVWPAALALHVTACVCRALAYAHGKSRGDTPLGIVHRDISPNNVLISDQGEVKLTDFGIAKAGHKREQTAAGVIKGKVAYMSPEQGIGGVIDRRSDIFSVGSMLYRMLTDRLPFEADNDMDSLLKVQKADFEPPEKVKPTISPAVSSIIMRAMRLAPSERYQTADEMLADVERALRNEFHSAGQTELKLWLEQLARRDNVPSIGKQRVAEGGIVTDVVGTDLSVGTSFELDDLEQASNQTNIALAGTRSAELLAKPGKPPKLPKDARDSADGGSTAEVRFRDLPSRRRSSFWFGAAFMLIALVGARFLYAWAEKRGVMAALGFGDKPGKTPSVAPPAPPPEPPPPPPPPPAPVAAADAAAAPVAGGDAGAAIIADNTPAKAPDAGGKPDDDEPDEEALLRDAVPDADSAVIGEDDAEVAPAAKAGGKSKKATPAPKPTAKAATAILHLSSSPKGAVVKTKARVLGRTPINLHFRTGNTYELQFVKKGYETSKRRVAVQGTKDKKVAVTLRKKAAKKTSFFRPHR